MGFVLEIGVGTNGEAFVFGREGPAWAFTKPNVLIVDCQVRVLYKEYIAVMKLQDSGSKLGFGRQGGSRPH